MEKIRRDKLKICVLGIVLIFVIVLSVVIIKNFIPSKRVMDLKDYYKVDSDKIMVVLKDHIIEERGLFLDKTTYLSYETVKEQLNHRFYWDSNENVLIYTTESEVVKSEIGKSAYYVNKSKKTVPYQIVKTLGNKVYIALDYVKLFTDIEYKVYTEPNRVVIEYDWEKEYLGSVIEKATQLRYKDSIKSDILVQLKKGAKVTYVDTEDKKESKFRKVITEDGIIGYVKENKMSKAVYEKGPGTHKEEEYSHITKDYTISMGWHQVTNQDANNNILNVLDQSKGINTISPTWFSIADNYGAIHSLASERYVERAHNANVEVWALCDDFNRDVDLMALLSYTSRREKLENELIANAIKYNLDGLNIDFENINAACAEHYLQFLRELSIKCRNNGIVLSIDDYIPAPYNSFYDLEEQGKIADYVTIMAYDEYHSNSEQSGSVSSMPFFQDAIDQTLELVDKERVIIGLPFYTRLWTEDADGKLSSAAYSMSHIKQILEANNAKVTWNQESGQNYAEFKTKDGTCKVWLEDSKSVEQRMKAAADAKVAGMAYWKLGMEHSSIWNVIQKYIN